MPIVRMDTLLREARAEGRAVAAFNCWDSNSIHAATLAAQRTGQPVIIQASPAEEHYHGAAIFCAMTERFAEATGATVAVHLDHGHTLEEVETYLQAGFLSVMLDGSRHPWDENVRLTGRTVELARQHGACVEGELGKVLGLEGDVEVPEGEDTQTDPEEAAEFVAATGVDCLAVSVGTIHGVYKGKPELNLPRLEAIAGKVSIPLVLHGGSGTPDDLVRECIALGIAKINVYTELQQAWTAGLRELIDADFFPAPGKFYTPAREALIQRMVEKVELFAGA